MAINSNVAFHCSILAILSAKTTENRDLIKSTPNKAAPEKDTEDKLKQLVCELLDGIRFLFKASHYREEQEVRVIQFRYHDENETQESDEIKVDVEQIPPRFYLGTPESFLCNKVILGPRAQNFQEWRWWIREQNPDMDVSKSEIKYGKSDS